MVTAPAQNPEQARIPKSASDMVFDRMLRIAMISVLVCTGADAFIAGGMLPLNLRSSAQKVTGHGLIGQRHLNLVMLLYSRSQN
jgi:hypothetical protein